VKDRSKENKRNMNINGGPFGRHPVGVGKEYKGWEMRPKYTVCVYEKVIMKLIF
jgi:hypothetical protein